MNEPLPDPGPGWHADPSGAPQYRYWDGAQWTSDVAPLLPPLPEPFPKRSGWLIAAIVGGSVLVAIVVTGVLAALGSSHNDHVTVSGTAHSIASKVTSIPSGVYNEVGAGSAGSLPKPLPGPLRAKNGKPLVLYMGSEYCPFCATERWAIVAALARFGTFDNLSITQSAGSPEVYPETPTFSFHGATYKSSYITFEGVEMRSNRVDPSGLGYQILDVPTPEQRQAMTTYDAPPYVPEQSANAIPFIDFGDSYLISGSTYSPQVLQGLTHDEIATAMAAPATAVSRGAIGSANMITATICILTKDQPANVCDSESIQALERDISAH